MCTRRRDDIVRLLALLEPGALSHPNKLEFEGNKAFHKAFKRTAAANDAHEISPKPPSKDGEVAQDEVRACLSRRAVVVVTVNRVQSVFSNPVYSSDCKGSPQQLDTYLSQGCDLDEGAYLHANSMSVHVPDVLLRQCMQQAQPVQRPRVSIAQHPRVSIVLPVHNAGSFLTEALVSLRQQELCDWECICVDDASKDGSAQILKDFATSDPRFRVCTCAYDSLFFAHSCLFVLRALRLTASCALIVHEDI